MFFRKLTRHDGNPIFVNINLVLSLRREGNETHIAFAGEDTLRVKETPEEIIG